MPQPDPALKGKKDGNCNRTACQAPGATWYNQSTRAFYCPRCGRLINKNMNASDIQFCREQYETERLCLSPEEQNAGT